MESSLIPIVSEKRKRRFERVDRFVLEINVSQLERMERYKSIVKSTKILTIYVLWYKK